MTDETRRIEWEAVDDLAARVRGEVLRPGDDGYEEARTVWNEMIDRRPSVVVQPVETADVRNAVEFARDHGLPVGVQGGGHNVAGNGVSDGGLTIDFAAMTSVEVDPGTRVARADPGITIGEFDAATQAHGLATPGGIVSTTGLAGLTLGGGWGWLSRTYGLAVDNLRSVEVVTADGDVLRASENKHADLFWAIRGGGGNFGVVTRFEFDVHEVGPTVLSGLLAYPFEVAPDLFRFHREFAREAPDELCCYAAVRTAPDLEFVPEDIRGKKITAVYLCYAGDPEEGEQFVQPLREFEAPVLDIVEARPYAEFQSMFDGLYPSGFRNYWKSQFVDEVGLSDEAIDTLCEYAATVTSPYSSIVIEHLGGAIAQRAPEETAYAHRDAGYAFNVFSRWEDASEDDHHLGWTREFFEAMVPLLDEGVYVNFLSRESQERVRDAFGENYERLAEVKTQYDPENLFRVNQNVRPA